MHEASPLRRIRSSISEAEHPLLWIVVIGLIIHIAMSVLQIVFDNDYWARVIRNIEAGEGLYGVVGYYYTPVWGYILGAISAFQSAFLDLGVDVIRIPQFFFSEIIDGAYYSATVPSIAFSLTVKAPLIASNLLMALLVRHLVIDVTQDDRRGNMAFALVFLCPLMIVAACVTAMPDTIAALFAVLTMLLLKKDRYILAGMTFSVAVLTKFFPAFLFFPMIAYVLVCKGDHRIGLRNLLLSAIGALAMTLIILLPQIMTGTLDQCFSFLSDRTGDTYGDSLFDIIVGKLRILVYIIVIAISVLIGRWVYRNGQENAFRNMMMGSFFTMAACMLYPPTPQYIVILIPFLAYWITVANLSYLRSWTLISASAAVFALSSNLLILLPISAWTGLIDLDWLAHWFSEMVTGDLSVATIWSLVFGSLTYFSILHLFWTAYSEKKKRGVNSDVC